MTRCPDCGADLRPPAVLAGLLIDTEHECPPTRTDPAPATGRL